MMQWSSVIIYRCCGIFPPVLYSMLLWHITFILYVHSLAPQLKFLSFSSYMSDAVAAGLKSFTNTHMAGVFIKTTRGKRRVITGEFVLCACNGKINISKKTIIRQQQHHAVSQKSYFLLRALGSNGPNAAAHGGQQQNRRWRIQLHLYRIRKRKKMVRASVLEIASRLVAAAVSPQSFYKYVISRPQQRINIACLLSLGPHCCCECGEREDGNNLCFRERKPTRRRPFLFFIFLSALYLTNTCMTNNEPKLCKYTHHSKPERERNCPFFFMEGCCCLLRFFFCFLFSSAFGVFVTIIDTTWATSKIIIPAHLVC